MVTCYSKQYLDEFEIIDKTFYSSKNPDAKKDRDTLARQLRKEGWKVTTKLYHFYDFGGSATYTLFAERKKPQTQVGEQPATAGV